MQTSTPQRASRRKPDRQKPNRSACFAVCLFLALLCVAAGTVLAVSKAHRTQEETQDAASTAAAPSPDTGLPSSDTGSPAAAPSPDDPLLILVNRAHPLPENYTPELTELQAWNLSVASVLYDDLCRMLTDGRAQGLQFTICSAYRSHETQQALFEEDVARYMQQGMSEEEAIAATEQYTMRPGCSEHETGLAVDIVSTAQQLLDESQASTPESQWLREHCWEYGFILRYPEDKSSITGIAYESWHYRYVGVSAAQYLHERNLTLEEFWAQEGGT